MRPQAKLLGSACSAAHKNVLQSELGKHALRHYEERLLRAGLLDMGDLQRLALQLMQKPHVRASLRARYAHVLVVRLGGNSNS